MNSEQSLQKPFFIDWQTLCKNLIGRTPDASPNEETYPFYLEDSLSQTELLLKYAAETGIDIDPLVRNAVLNARMVISSNGWNQKTAEDVLTALTKLTERVKPVSGESLECTKRYCFRRLWGYCIPVVLLALVIGAFSVATFVASGLSTAIRTDIATANELVVKLRAQLDPLPNPDQTDDWMTGTSSVSASSDSAPPKSEARTGISEIEIITELQQFAATIRAIDGRARQLDKLAFLIPESNRVQAPFAEQRTDPKELRKLLELPPHIPYPAAAASHKIRAYQEVRYFAQRVLDEVSLGFGAITTCILPVLYALLGTCAYLFRSFKKHIRQKTYIPSYANFARFLIAAIGGAVVGLFNNFNITQGATISPLALAFLVGYAVDVFYAFLDGLLHQFNSTPASRLPKGTLAASHTSPSEAKLGTLRSNGGTYSNSVVSSELP
jgi:hypothetical protein